MENIIKITEINVNLNRITYVYKISGDWKKYFRANNKYFVEYETDISKVPKSVLVLPFLCNIIQLSWLADAIIEVDEIDEDFYNSVKEFKKGFEKMYPMLEFKGGLKADKIIFQMSSPTDKTAVFFSGGVDATASLISNMDKKPSLIAVWGQDLSLGDYKGWLAKKDIVSNTATMFGLDAEFLKSNYKKAINHKQINKMIKTSGETWWHGFQHGLSLLGASAPLVYAKNISTLYIASTYTEKSAGGNITCASDPSIDDFVRFCGAKVTHDGFNLTRLDKYRLIDDYAKLKQIKINIHVCWYSWGGNNCCKCEKCLRTIFGMISQGIDPRDYGFNYNDTDLNKMTRILLKKTYVDNITKSFWNEIKSDYLQSGDKLDKLKWLKAVDFNTIDFENRSIITKLFIKIRMVLNEYRQMIFKS